MQRQSPPSSLGEGIRRIRARLQKSQGEFAEILGSQQNSVSRYETDQVKPGVVVLWKLYNLANHPEERDLFTREIRKQIGTPAVMQKDGTFDKSGSIEALRPIIEQMEAEDRRDVNPEGRKDIADLLWAVDQFLADGRVNKSLIEILALWVKYRRQKGASPVLRDTAKSLRKRLAQQFGE